jgi:hypothetical protein
MFAYTEDTYERVVKEQYQLHKTYVIGRNNKNKCK